MSSNRPRSGRNISTPSTACSASTRCGGTTARRTRISRSTAKSFRDTMNPNLPRHAIWRPGMTWDASASSMRRVRHPMNRGRVGPDARGSPTWTRWASTRRSSIRPGSPRASTSSAIPTSRMRWRAPTTTGSPISARPIRAGCSRRRCCRCRTWTSPLAELRRVAGNPLLPRRLHPADVRPRAAISPARTTIRCGRSSSGSAWSPRCTRRRACGTRNGPRTGRSSRR